QDPVAIRFSVGGNLTSAGANLRATLQAAKAYADMFTRYDAAQADYLKKKQEFEAAKARASTATAARPATGGATEKKPEEPKAPTAPEKPRVIEAMEPFRALFASKIPALVEAKRADAIKLAVKIFRDEFKVRTVLLGADDAFRLADLIAEKD